MFNITNEQSPIEWISLIFLILIALFFIYSGLKYTPEKHRQTKEESIADLRTKNSFEYKWLAKFLQKAPWWVGRIFFIAIGVVIMLLAAFGKRIF
ncbi:hypothetical protein CEH05_07445 [Halobacillus halophilus]|nr:hypothetical protein CEH05_07445 [Halobacillus halophilus]